MALDTLKSAKRSLLKKAVSKSASFGVKPKLTGTRASDIKLGVRPSDSVFGKPYKNLMPVTTPVRDWTNLGSLRPKKK